MRFKFWLIPMLLITLLAGQALLAQATTPTTVELVGTIEAINPDGSVVVNGQTILLTGAELNVALAVGQVVKIEGALQADGSVAASEVNAPEAGDLLDNEVEITGVVDSFDGITLVIGGLTIDLTAAEIDGPITVGQVVKVHASFDANGNLVAREAEGSDDSSDPSPEATPEVEEGDDQGEDTIPAGEFEIVGTLDSIGDGFIVVNGQTIDITGAEIKDPLVVGALVKLHLRVQDNQQLAAREVENARDRTRDRIHDGTPESTPEAEATEDSFGSDDHSGSGNMNTFQWEHTYTIRAGDTLSDIAVRAGTTVEELMRVNNLTNAQVIVAGTVLRVPHEIHASNSDDSQGGNSGQGNSGSDSFDDGPDHDQFDDHGMDDSSHDSDDDHGGDSGSNSGSDDHDDDHDGDSDSGGGHDD